MAGPDGARLSTLLPPTRKTHWLRFRAVGYATALGVMVVAFASAMLLRIPFEVDVLRERGELYQQLSDGTVSNQYRLRVLNKSQHSAEFSLSVSSELPLEIVGARTILATPGELLDLPLSLHAEPDAVGLPNYGVEVSICELAGSRCVQETTRFLGPSRS